MSKKNNSTKPEVEPHENPLVAISDDDNLPVLSNPALHRYLQEISQYELLSREETEDLAIQFRETGDPNAAYRLVSSNLRLVVKVAMDFQKYWMQNFMDPKWSESWTGAFDEEMFTQYMNMMMNPAMMNSMMAMANPAIMTQWMTMMTNPAIMGGMMQMADPTPYMAWMTNPDMINAMMKMGDPTPYLQMVTNPQYMQMMMQFTS